MLDMNGNVAWDPNRKPTAHLIWFPNPGLYDLHGTVSYAESFPLEASIQGVRCPRIDVLPVSHNLCMGLKGRMVKTLLYVAFSLPVRGIKEI